VTETGLGPLAQVAVTFRDLPTAIAFYRDVLALPLMFETGGMAFFAMGDVRLMMTEPEDPEFDHPASVLYLKVKHIDATYAGLVARGVAFDEGPHLIGTMGTTEIWMAFFRDSEQHMLAITEERTGT